MLTEALTGLTATPQKTLSPWLFYDEPGSELFEQITELPEYYLTRTERSLFAAHSDEILREFLAPGAPSGWYMPAPDPFTIAELGGGSASKTSLLLQAAIRLQPTLLYQPIDVSSTALAAIEELTASIPGLSVRAQLANYVTDPYSFEHPPLYPLADQLPEWKARTGAMRSRVLALYIGSSIGNFSPEEANTILRRLRSHLQPGDALLLGADLAPHAHKPVSTILTAYDDPAGITAAFNLNVLARLNRELDADFDLRNFTHRVRWNGAESRIEMHLESLVPQTVHIRNADQLLRIHFAQGETIHTENSYKFSEEFLHALLTRAGFTPTRIFHGAARSFSLILAHTL